MTLQPLQIAPGIVKDETEYSSEGRYVDGDKIINIANAKEIFS